MKELTGTFMTDAIGLDACRLTIGALVGSLWDTAEHGLPSLLNHDFTRPIGWTRHAAIVIEPGLARTVGSSFIAESEAEQREVNTLLNAFLRRVLEDKQSMPLARLRDLLREHLDGTERPMCLDGPALVGNDLARRTLPSLFDEDVLDKDGLLPLDRLDPVGPGVYRVGELLVFAHPYLRRSFHRLNTLNTPFLRLFQETAAKSTTKRIRLDRDMIGLAEGYVDARMERSLWSYGAPFSDDVASIAAGVHRLEATDVERAFHSISRTECFWYLRDGFHSFESEELRDVPLREGGVSRYACRYAHAMIPSGTNDPSHFDGAVRIYSEDAMIERLDVTFDNAGRNTEYLKLWRMDGVIPIAEWKRLLADYYRDNPHVGEYLGGEPSAPSAVREPLDGIQPPPRERYVPYSFPLERGIRVALSFRPPLELPTDRWMILPTLGMDTDEGPHAILPGEALDLSKAIGRRGGDLRLPDHFLLESAWDSYCCYPLVNHADRAAVSVTVEALADLIAARRALQKDFIVSACVRFSAGDLDAVVSVAGGAGDVLAFLQDGMMIPPLELEELMAWGDRAGSWMRERELPQAGPSIEAILAPNGEFYIRREQIPPEVCRVQVDEKGFRYELTLPESQADVMDAVASGDLAIALHYLSKVPRCSSCGEPYDTCPCCRWLDRGVRTQIEEVVGYGGHWTDRPIGEPERV